MPTRVTERCVSAGTNQSANSLAVSCDGDWLVYASDLDLVSVAINPGVTSRTIAPRRHTAAIKALASIFLEFFVTGGADGRLVLWRLGVDGLTPSFSGVGVEGKKAVAGIVGSIADDEHATILGTFVSGAEYAIKVITVQASTDLFSFEGSETLVLPGKAFALAVDFATLHGCELLALGTSSRTIEVFTKQAEFRSHALLATSGQDNMIKIWRIQRELPTDDAEELTVTKNRFDSISADGVVVPFYLHVDAVLCGHEDWVHSVSWDLSGKRLVSASSDKTVIVWTEDELSGVWTDMVRLGLVGGQAAGFYGAHFVEGGMAIVASSYYGALHAWRADKEDEYRWDAFAIPGGGHPSPVRDIAWEPSAGSYLISVGTDKTTRIHAPLKDGVWTEVARPQMHGHDMQCVASLGPTRFVSGAEEKIFRAFNAPETFANSLEAVCGVEKKQLFAGLSLSGFGASVPALGLSNKAVDEGEAPAEDERAGDAHWEEAAFAANPASLTAAPTEDVLMQNTLWPEIHKLYGHGYEVYAVAASPSGKLLATACKASHAEHAAILIWSTEDWSQRGQATNGHQLTVAQLEWSPCGTRLLSVSRDRTAVIYGEADGNVDGYKWSAIWRSTKEHSRIIWSCCWAADSTYFATAGRDQKVIVWRFDGNTPRPLIAMKLEQAVTAISISPERELGKSHIVAGLQNGCLQVFSIDLGQNQLVLIDEIGANDLPGIDSPINRIRFRPPLPAAASHLFAVAGTDFKVRLYEIEGQ
ncbi:unnamed protein product, partial [Mesorhabditis spiculigera]